MLSANTTLLPGLESGGCHPANMGGDPGSSGLSGF